jgi:copper chaperone NosL
MRRTALVIAGLFALAACREEIQAERPAPVAMTEEALGYYCQMNLTEHPGPKAQVHLDGLPEPLFFSQVRDAIAYQRMPEQSHRITAVYVSDMGAAESWAQPGAENWIADDAAYYVVGSAIVGGMGAPELVPFNDHSAAEAFAGQHGGTILALAEIDDAEVLAPVEFTLDAQGNFLPPEDHARH